MFKRQKPCFCFWRMHLGPETAQRLFCRCSRFLGNKSRWKGATLLVAFFYLQFICLPAYHSNLFAWVPTTGFQINSNDLPTERWFCLPKYLQILLSKALKYLFGILSGDFGGNILYIILKGHHSLRQPYGLIISLIASIPYLFTNRKKILGRKAI